MQIPSSLYKRAAHRRNSRTSIFSNIANGFISCKVFIDGDNTAQNATDGLLEVKNIHIYGPSDLLLTNAAGFDIDTWFGTSGWANNSNTDVNYRIHNLDLPNAQPTGLHWVLQISRTHVSTMLFFDKVTYIGAFGGGGATADWTRDGAAPQELNVSCLVETKDVANYISSIKLFPTVANDHASFSVESG
ncbi:MAG: hypothetical protein R2778_02805 [Saprospiraceae bacterium]